jgi:hypothetical protein
MTYFTELTDFDLHGFILLKMAREWQCLDREWERSVDSAV